MNATALRAAVRRRYRAQTAILTPRIREQLKLQPFMDERFAVTLNVSQNVLREAMEEVTTQSLPQQHPYFIELAVRLACYAITALPADDQEQAAMLVREGLLNKLADMQAGGVVIKTEWD